MGFRKTNSTTEMKDSGWRFDKIISMTIYFYKTQDLNGSILCKNTYTI